MFSDTPKRLRWPRSQRFTLSDSGLEAEATYRSSIVASRMDEGRASFDRARVEWAERLGIQPEDGVYLCEIRARPLRLGDIVEALEACDKTRQEAVDALGRLLDAGLVATSE
jgi:hypothetical protein